MRRKRKTKLARATGRKPHFRRALKLSLSWIRFPSRAQVLRMALVLTWLGCIGGLVAAWSLGVPKLRTSEAKTRLVDPLDITVRFINAPSWFKGDLANTLLRTAQTNLAGNPMERDDLVAVRENLLRTGWFDSIDQVRRVKEDAVEITAHFAKPYTILRDERGDHLIDMRGRLLPKSYHRGARTQFHFIAISGAHFPRPQRAGMQWEGADIAAGLKLLQFIDRQPWREQVVEIDVSQYLADGPLKLRTDRGCTILWGGAPGEEPALEVLAADKLQRLTYMHDRSGRIDANRDGELDITGEKLVVARN